MAWDKTVANHQHIFSCTIPGSGSGYSTVYNCLSVSDKAVIDNFQGTGNDIIDGYITPSQNINVKILTESGTETAFAGDKYQCPVVEWIYMVNVSSQTASSVTGIVRLFTSERTNVG